MLNTSVIVIGAYADRIYQAVVDAEYECDRNWGQRRSH